uniref:Isochorismatase domain-containing protein 1 n=1 Tax=Ciona savignyi TaxID=51511 RepID=H2ZRB6_CIOSA
MAEMVECLLISGDRNVVSTLNLDCNKTEVFNKYTEVFDQQVKTLETWDKHWESWVEVSDDFSLKEGGVKFRNPKIKNNVALGNLAISTSVIFCCDMQERFRPAINYFDEIVQVGSRMVKGGRLLQIPLVVTEQYPKGLGNTVKELEISNPSVLATKTKFSMLTPEVEAFLANNNFASVILFGVEAHVCVQQTAIDLISRGYEVHLLADATSSRSPSDRLCAFKRLRKLGVFVTTTEAVLLQLVTDKNHEKFKEIQNLIKVLPPDTGLTLKCNI